PDVRGIRAGKDLAALVQYAGQLPGRLAVRHQISGYLVQRADHRPVPADEEGDRTGTRQRRYPSLRDPALRELDPHHPERAEGEQLPRRAHAEQRVAEVPDGRRGRLRRRRGGGPDHRRGRRGRGGGRLGTVGVLEEEYAGEPGREYEQQQPRPPTA